jgi:hypothetical protein
MHAPFIVSKRCRVTIMLAHNVILLVEGPGSLRRALSGGNVIDTADTWRRYFWHCCYVSGMGTTVEGVVSVLWHYSDASRHS